MTRLLVPALVLCACAAAQPMSGVFSGTVSDPSGARVPQAVVTVTDTAGHRATAYSDDEGAFAFNNLPAGQYAVEARHAGFALYRRENVNVTGSGDVRLDLPLQVGAVNEALEVTAPRSGPRPATPAARAPARVRVGGNVQPPRLVRSTRPVYPEAARQLGAEGTVTLDGVIGTDGSVLSLQPASQTVPAELVTAAMEAVRQWRYTPTLLNGVPVEVQLTIVVNFRLQ